jgi:hypothetical protein
MSLGQPNISHDEKLRKVDYIILRYASEHVKLAKRRMHGVCRAAREASKLGG